MLAANMNPMDWVACYKANRKDGGAIQNLFTYEDDELAEVSKALFDDATGFSTTIAGTVGEGRTSYWYPLQTRVVWKYSTKGSQVIENRMPCKFRQKRLLWIWQARLDPSYRKKIYSYSKRKCRKKNYHKKISSYRKKISMLSSRHSYSSRQSWSSSLEGYILLHGIHCTCRSISLSMFMSMSMSMMLAANWNADGDASKCRKPSRPSKCLQLQQHDNLSISTRESERDILLLDRTDMSETRKQTKSKNNITS
jgi:hypothetical protein